MSGVFSEFSVKSFWSGFWTTLRGPRLNGAMIDVTAISTYGITTFSFAVKFASNTRFSTVKTALSTAFLISSSNFFSMTWYWRGLFSPTVILLKIFERTSVWGSKVAFLIQLALVLYPMTKWFKVSFNCFACWCFFFGVKNMFFSIFELHSELKINRL